MQYKKSILLSLAFITGICPAMQAVRWEWGAPLARTIYSFFTMQNLFNVCASTTIGWLAYENYKLKKHLPQILSVTFLTKKEAKDTFITKDEGNNTLPGQLVSLITPILDKTYTLKTETNTLAFSILQIQQNQQEIAVKMQELSEQLKTKVPKEKLIDVSKGIGELKLTLEDIDRENRAIREKLAQNTAILGDLPTQIENAFTQNEGLLHKVSGIVANHLAQDHPSK